MHKHDGYLIHFAKRGSSDRTEALQNSLDAARLNLRASWGITASSPIEIRAGEPKAVVCLQAADYYLWAVQRLFERGEDRFLQLVWSQVGLVHDVDDTRLKDYGVYYTQANPLTAESRA